LHLTDGVYGLQLKYTGLSNANGWFWVLLGNDDLKGLEFLKTDSSTPETGGRIQYPVPYGEVAATFHNRKIDLSEFGLSDAWETRFALDGRWDRIIGFWFEAVCQKQSTDFLPFEWSKFATLGMDYTFGIGNGLHVLGEHLVTVMSRFLPEWPNTLNVSACVIRYPSGIFDSLSIIGYYHWDEKAFAPHLSWTRTLDDLDVTLSLFDYPKTSDEGAFTLRSEAAMPGSGIQLILVYHH